MENLKKENLSTIEKRILKFNDSKLSKIMKVGVEILGVPCLNMVYSEIVGGIERKKLLTFQQIWDENDLDFELDENNKSQVELVEHAILKSVRCSKEGQIRKIIAILKSSFKGNIISVNDAEDLINVISELSENEAVCLAKIYKVFENIKGNKEIKKYGEKDIIDIPQDKKVYLFNRLAGKGLIYEKTGAIYDYAGGDFFPTKLGETLFKSIQSL